MLFIFDDISANCSSDISSPIYHADYMESIHDDVNVLLVINLCCPLPNACSDCARASQSFRHVENFFSGDQIKLISFEAYLSTRGCSNLPFVVIILSSFIIITVVGKFCTFTLWKVRLATKNDTIL